MLSLRSAYHVYLTQFVAYIFFTTFCLSDKVQTVAPPAPTITAPFGKIIGQHAPLDPSVQQYLGIQYGQPPTGSRRFAPPVRTRVSKHTTPIVATRFGNACPQISVELGGPVNATGSPLGEDCLNLNIWTKPGRERAPVMVWLHGGGFKFGAGSYALYDGTQFAANNPVVLVTINYRLSVFGFPNAPGVKSENLGILDQRLALEWVRDNIEAFGGDPKRITVFGESAGATSIEIHAYAWPKNPIVNGFIAQSGTTKLIPFLDGPADYSMWRQLTEKVGCAKAKTEKGVLKCMQEASWESIVEGTGSINVCAKGVYEDFGPRVDGKIVFSPEEYSLRAQAGLFAKVPLLIGTTDQEVFANNGSIVSPVPCIPELPKNALSPEAVAEFATSVGFGCPANDAAQYRARNNVPVWRYRYYGSFTGLGAGHAAELPVLFGTVLLLRPEGVTPREAAFIKYFQSVWAAFAVAPSTGLSAAPINLPRYDPLKSTLIRLDFQQEVEASLGNPYEDDYMCFLVSP